MIIAVLATAACSSGVRADRSAGYLEELSPIARDVNFSLAALGDTLDRPYESTMLRSTALADVRIGRDLAIARDRAERLEPAPDLAADHDRYLAFLSDAQGLAAAFDAAVAGGDLAAAALTAVELETSAGSTFLDLTDRTCAAVSFDKSLCVASGDPDRYGAVVLAEMRRLAVGYVPLMRDAPAALTRLTRSEAETYREVADAEAASILDGAVASIASADPPPELAEDHRILLEGLTAAAAAHRGGPGDPRLILCETAARLSADAGPLTAVLMSDDDLDCAV